MDRKITSALKQLLAIYWLRPETALWRTLDCQLMSKQRPKGLGVDLGCGTGALSYVMAGGKVSHYDSFLNVHTPTSASLKADFYNTRAAFKPRTDNTELRYTFDYGVDHKSGLLDQAKQFKGFYKHTLRHDLNRPLPFSAGRFDWAFSNVLYWLNDVTSVLKGWAKILKSKGRLYLFVPNQHFKDRAWLYYKAPHKGRYSYLNFFDRGYNALIRHGYGRRGWESIFKRSGFRVVAYKPYLSLPVMDIWNIGTRPISPLLIDMAARLSPRHRIAAQGAWVTFFQRFFQPVLQQEWTHRQKEADCAFHFFVLEKT